MSQANLKSIVLAGGTGSRLAPLTGKEQNKHLLPVYKYRMIQLPLFTLVNSGLTDVVITTGGLNPGSFINYLTSGANFGLTSLSYCYQPDNGGICAAISAAEASVGKGTDVCVVLGDNYFEDSLDFFKPFIDKRIDGAVCVVKKVSNPTYFGVLELDSNSHILSIEEKPSQPKSDLAILGAYLFDETLWQRLKTIKMSSRGELEITDLLRSYLADNKLKYVETQGYWQDCGTFSSLMEVSNRLADKDK